MATLSPKGLLQSGLDAQAASQKELKDLYDTGVSDKDMAEAKEKEAKARA